MRHPPLNALRSFEAAGRHLSLRKAAQELFVTPAAVSHQIKSLETQLQVALFKRLPRRVELTPQGQQLLNGLTPALAQIAEAVNAAVAMNGSQRISLATTPALGSLWLAPRLHRFTQAHPEMELQIFARTSLIDSVRAESDEEPSLLGNADLAIRSGDGHYPGLVAHWMFELSTTPMCSPDLLVGPRPLERPDDLRHHTLLHHQTEIRQMDATRPSWKTWLNAAGIEDIDAQRGPSFNQVGMAMEAATDGMGVVLGMPVLASHDLSRGRLVMPFSLVLPIGASYYLVHSKAVENRPAVCALRDWILQQAHDEPWAGHQRA